MEFLNRMKKREYVEMGLKTAIGILLGIIVVFLMEAMIYNIYIDAIKSTTKYSGKPEAAVYYVVENDNSTYDVYLHYDDENSNWALNYNDLSQDDFDEKMIAERGALYGTDSTLYKIVVNEGATNETTYEYSQEGTPIAKVKAQYKNNHNGETFTVYTKEDAASAYVLHSEDLSYTNVIKLFSDKGEFKKYDSAKVIFRMPNCFDIYMNATHYIVIVVFLLAIGGVFVWRFTLITKEYKKLEKKLKKTGKVF